MVIDGRDRVYDETAVATTPAEGRRIVAEQADMGFRFVKVYNALAPDVYAAIVAEAGRRGMPVVGHIPDAVSIEAAVRAGQRSVEHFNGFAPVIAAESASAAEMAFLAVPVDSAAVERLADLLADLGVFVVPTFTAFARAAPVERAREMFDRPEHAYMHPQLTEGWAVELLRRFLLHRLPRGFHHIRHYGLLGNRHRERQIACCRELLGQSHSTGAPDPTSPLEPHRPACPACGSTRLTPLQLLPALPRLAPGARPPP